MTGYAMTLIINGRELPIPVLPEKLEIASQGKNEKTTVLELGEILMLKRKGLRSVSWESLFPAQSAPFATWATTSPAESVRAIQAARDADKPIRLLLTGADLDVNMSVGVDSFDYEERGGEPGDIYYIIKLTEWKDYSPKRIILLEETALAAEVQEPPRAGEPEDAGGGQYSVVKGDSLWAIAKRHYGDGSRWNEIYEANRAEIGANPNMIYPGQVFTLP